eukprot:TRINITY_DN1296_c0_g1_i1.p1 TRINITY_DN1296_c0_g1~~TRINITY_DN1296_c0_g1_i1.p1  ORF type:complete len:301 (+),score=76.60 TRINITY_DN1296_c0_g1_i1:42-944(+)
MSQQTILITGASRGFGKILTQTVAAQGLHVIASMRGSEGKNKDAADELRSWALENEYHLDIIELDVTSQESVDAAMETIKGLSDRVDILVNNAGVGLRGFTEVMGSDQLHSLWEVNYFGLIRVTQGVLPIMKAQGSGLIINIGSGLAFFSVPSLTHYSATKAAVHSITEAWRLEFSELGIETVVVHPGAYATDFGANSSNVFPLELFAQYPRIAQLMEGGKNVPRNENIQEVADAIVDLINQPHGSRQVATWVGLPASASAAANAWSDMKWKASVGVSSAFSGGVDFVAVKNSTGETNTD